MMAGDTPFLSVQNVWKSYPACRSPWQRTGTMTPVLRGVCFTLEKGGTAGLLGESGSGKSTLSRLILGVEKPDAGDILIEGQPVDRWRKAHRGKISVVFQDHTSSVDPRLSVEEIIAEGIRAVPGRRAGRADVLEMLERVELPARLARRLPHELSGGQVQRVCIARALASRPELIVFDEAVSSLDVSVQTEIVDLLERVKGETGYLFITHDIQVAAMLYDKMLILQHGIIAEEFEVRTMGEIASPCLQRILSSTIVFQSTFRDDTTRSL